MKLKKERPGGNRGAAAALATGQIKGYSPESLWCRPADKRLMPSKFALNVSLTPELAAFLAGKVITSHHRSASEVVRATPRLPDEQDRRADRQTSKGTRNAR